MQQENGTLLTVKQNYSHHYRIKFLTKSIESSLYNYSDACILVTEGIIVKEAMKIQ